MTAYKLSKNEHHEFIETVNRKSNPKMTPPHSLSTFQWATESTAHLIGAVESNGISINHIDRFRDKFSANKMSQNVQWKATRHRIDGATNDCTEWGYRMPFGQNTATHSLNEHQREMDKMCSSWAYTNCITLQIHIPSDQSLCSWITRNVSQLRAGDHH